MEKYENDVLKDIGIITLSILIAIILAKTGVLIKILGSTHGLELLGSFIAGIFFTSIFTTAPAIATLGEIAQMNSLFSTALFGALGAVLGDLLIFRFVEDRFSKHLMEIVSHQSILKRFTEIFRLKIFRWITILIGGLIIASPLPDELGISLMGFSKMRLSRFIPISFIFNFLGILAIGGIARAIQ